MLILARCWSRLSFLKVVMFKVSRVELTPEVLDMQVLCVHCVIILYHGNILPLAFHDTLPRAFVIVHFCKYVCLVCCVHVQVHVQVLVQVRVQYSAYAGVHL